MPLYFFYTMLQKSQKWPKTQIKGLRKSGPLEAVLVIFGRWAFIFFCLKALGKYENDATFVHTRSDDHLGDAKMSKKGASLRRI